MTQVTAAPPTFWALLTERTETHGDRVALIDDFETITYAQLHRRAARISRGLAECGVGPGDAVAVWLPNWIEWLELQFALARRGAIAVALNTRFQSHEIADIVFRSRARMLVLSSDFHPTDVATVLHNVSNNALTALRTTVDIRRDGTVDPRLGGLLGEVIPYHRLREGAGDADDLSTPESPCTVFTSSGTTSRPKLVYHTQRGVITHARAVARSMGYDAPDSVILGMLPFCGVFGFNTLMAAVAGGAAAVLMSVFDAPKAVALAERHAVTQTQGTDEMYRRLFGAMGDRSSVGSFRWGGYANFSGDPVALARNAESHGVLLFGVYGSSELQALITHQPLDSDLARRSVMGGVPVSAETKFRIRDVDGEGLCDAGDVGELEVKGPSMMGGYLYDDQATLDAFTDDGYFRTGDLAYQMPAGGFGFVSRRGDAIRLAGFLVSPREIEIFLEEVGGIRTAQVVAADTDAGHQAVAFVVLEHGATLDEAAVIAHCRGTLAKYKVPRRVVPMERFPTTTSPNGEKIQRNRLREMATQLMKVDAQ
jgi:fatty-acyl-CoA synthase